MQKLATLSKCIVIIIVFLSVIYIIFQKPKQNLYSIKLVTGEQCPFLIDDFNYKINNNYWNLITQGNNYNNELQYYQPQNISVTNGNLKITAKQESFQNHKYTSGLLSTKNKFEFLYGRVIFKAKVADIIGLLSAIWLLPADDSYLPEIDIIEVLGEKPQEVWSGVHYSEEDSIKKDFNSSMLGNTEYNTYELEWREDVIKWYINNKLVHQTKKGIPHQAMYLVINLAVGGDWPKNPDSNFKLDEFLIDYLIIIPEEKTQ